MSIDWLNHPNPLIRAQIQAALGELAPTCNTVQPDATVEPKKRRGVPNKTELRRIQYWTEQGYQVHFEAIKVRLADGAWYTPDLIIGSKLSGLLIEEVKGAHIREAAMVRFKVAAEQLAWLGKWQMVQWKGGKWRTVL